MIAVRMTDQNPVDPLDTVLPEEGRDGVAPGIERLSLAA